MTLERDFHMIGGTGESSYASNSTIQKKMAYGAMFMVKEALESLVTAVPSSQTVLVYADLGCSTGANTFAMLPELMETISTTCDKLARSVPEIQLLLNDLPGNDFNTLLGPVLSSYKERINESMRDKCVPFYVAAVPGSFYKRLFPKFSVHFVYTSASLHWLSQVPHGLNNAEDGPINNKSIWISKKSPPAVSKLYLEQFQKDFSSFLKYRSEELCSEGHMTLILPGRTSVDPLIEDSALWLLWHEEALYELVSQGIVKAAAVDSFNIPLYFPSMEELVSIVEMEGSFAVFQNNVCEVPYSASLDVISDDLEENLKKVENIGRSVMEPLLSCHFGNSMIDPFYSVSRKIMAKHFGKEEYKFVTITISLKKK